MPSKQCGLQLILASLLGLAYSLAAGLSASSPGPIPQDLSDLYGIFKDEILANPSGNVYQTLGNRFQLDGPTYSAVLKALDAYDLLHGTYTADLDSETRQQWIPERLEETRQAFGRVVEVLDWPRFEVELREGGIGLLARGRSAVLEKTVQPVLLRFDNQTGAAQRMSWEILGLAVRGRGTELRANSRRYLLGQLSPSSKAQIEFRFRNRSFTVQQTIDLEVVKSGLLQGVLVEEAAVTQPLARVRVTDRQDRYYPPEDERFGLIVRPRQQAQRWTYVEGQFEVRVPAGPVKISVRRGLEYSPIDLQIQVEAGQTVRRVVPLKRWANLEKEGWYSGDTHLHLLDPPSALFEMRAENLRVANVLVMKHLGVTYSREHFRGQLDPLSDQRHLLYYNEEYRNQPLGHVSLLNLKTLVEPISTGGLAVPRAGFSRYFYRQPRHRTGFALPRHGELGWPDSPLLLEVMRETHRQGGMVNWAHLRSSQREFPIDAAFGEIDTVDILTHTRLPEALKLWYHLLNCGLRLPATAGTDRESPEQPVGHQRVYVRLKGPLTYQGWIDGLRRGHSFVTNGPVVSLKVEGLEAGGELKLTGPRSVRVEAEAKSQLPFQRLEVVVNGKVVRSVIPHVSGRQATLKFEQSIEQTSWIAARCMGDTQQEFFDWSHPLFAHTNPVYLDFGGRTLAQKESGCYWLDFLKQLDEWASQEAYYENKLQKEKALSTIREGMNFYRIICES